ncbi:MAG: redoxin family protein [Candidatus Kaiserbacteria bacterium]|nr:MAG: redoxin family protein [Candidatus Kaiserbacteria bacterium]
MENSSKTFVVVGLIVLAVVIALVALFNTNPSGAAREAGGVGADLIGAPLPSVTLYDKDGKAYPMESLAGKNVVLFFNEGLMCYPACWDQMTAFGADPRFNSDETVALSVVVDSPADWQQAIAKMPELSKAATLFDQGAAVSRQLGVLSYGSSMHAGQLPGHTYVLLDKAGIVREVFDDPNMGVNNDAIMQKISAF